MFTMLGRSLALVLLVATLVPAAPVDRTSHSAPLPQSSPKRFLSKASTPSLHRIRTNRIASSLRYSLDGLSCSSYRRVMPHPRC